jgi:hypothetical protein
LYRVSRAVSESAATIAAEPHMSEDGAMRSLLVSLAGAALISCGGSGGQAAAGGSGGPSDGAGGPSDGGGGTGGAPDAGLGPVSGVRIRFVNTFLPSGTTGPTLDLYDAVAAGYGGGTFAVSPATLLVAGLAYGAVSDYVAPHLDAAGSTTVFLMALPAGSPPTDTTDAVGVWPGIDDGSHAQLTLLLENLGPSNLPGAGLLDGIGSSPFVEKGDDGSGNAGPLAPPPPPGQAEFLASTAPIDVTPMPLVASYYFFIDDSCAPPLNGDPGQSGVPLLFALSTATPQSFFALFPTTPGTHQLSVVAWTDRVLPTCAQLTARQGAASVTVTAGQQSIAFVYGSSLTDLHLVTAPIAP